MNSTLLHLAALLLCATTLHATTSDSIDTRLLNADRNTAALGGAANEKYKYADDDSDYTADPDYIDGKEAKIIIAKRSNTNPEANATSKAQKHICDICNESFALKRILNYHRYQSSHDQSHASINFLKTIGAEVVDAVDETLFAERSTAASKVTNIISFFMFMVLKLRCKKMITNKSINTSL